MLRALAFALALLTTAGRANTLTDGDLQGLYAFDGKAATVLQGIRDARTSSGLPANECLQNLTNQLTLVVAEFKFVETLAQSEQGSPSDDTQAKAALLLRADKFLLLMPQDRKAISTTMQSCAGNGLVAAKGQQILRLFDDEAFYREQGAHCRQAAQAWLPERLLPRFDSFFLGLLVAPG